MGAQEPNQLVNQLVNEPVGEPAIESEQHDTDPFTVEPLEETSEQARKARPALWRLIKVLAVIALASAVLFFIQRNTDSEVRTYSIAPEFEFTTYDGETVRLADLRGQGVVLNFWGSWSGPCRAETPMLVDAWERERDNGVVFIGLTYQDTEQGARKFMQEYGMTYPNGPDVGQKWSRRYDVQGIPATFFIDADGMLVSQHRGMLFSAEDLAQRLDEIRP